MAVFGFIGTGNMGGALATAAAKSVGGENLILSNRTPEKAKALAEALGAKSGSNSDAVKADYILIGVKPQMMAGLFEEIAPMLQSRNEKGERFVLVTMAAGLTMEKIQTLSGLEKVPVIRIMPNTPASIGQGVVLYDSINTVEEELSVFLSAFQAAGLLQPLPENLIDAGSAVSGCGPAFVYLFIEALADGGVECGLPRAAALRLAAQTLIGSASLVLESGKHPGQLKDEVCSPGGTTIAGVHALEKGGFRALAMDAVKAAYDKTRGLKSRKRPAFDAGKSVRRGAILLWIIRGSYGRRNVHGRHRNVHGRRRYALPSGGCNSRRC